MSNIQFHNVSAFSIPLPDKSVHCVGTSPPYWALRDYGVEEQLGLEKTPEEYIANMVNVFREVKRVLRDDGTLWLNIGDSYFGGGYSNHRINGEDWKGRMNGDKRSSRQQDIIRQNPSLKPKDLVGIPWMLAFALRADGWYLRQDIIWHKPNPMPESVTDRCTKSHEYVFLLTKSKDYFYDCDAIRIPITSTDPRNMRPPETVSRGPMRSSDLATMGLTRGKTNQPCSNPLGANRRSVWTISTQSYRGAHFATFPEKLVEPWVLAGTSEKGCCPTCGAQWNRVVEKARVPTRPGDDTKVTGDKMTDGNRDPQRHVSKKISETWVPGCSCGVADTAPCTVLDPFAGSGTLAVVCDRLGRDFHGIELNTEYIGLAWQRLEADRAKRAEVARKSEKRKGRLAA